MIKYNLTCVCKKTFESWFSSSVEFDLLKKRKLINCIYCNSSLVRKSIMAPNLSKITKKSLEKIKNEKKFKKQLIEIRQYIEKNCKNVGDNFPQEARSIHYDKKSSKGIYGKATPEETKELMEEGIDVTTFPWIKSSDN